MKREKPIELKTTGHALPDKHEICEVCRGSGFTVKRDLVYICKACGGSGYSQPVKMT